LPFAIARGGKATWQFRLSFTIIREASMEVIAHFQKGILITTWYQMINTRQE
jgi:hypothetical protein